MEKIPSTIESPSDKIRRLVMDVIGRVNIVEFQNKMVAFAKQIRKNHPDFYYYRCYHRLIGSTPPERSNIEEDFEGGDSIVAFLEGLLKTG